MELRLFLPMLGFLWVAAINDRHAGNVLMVAFGVGGLILLYPALHLILKISGSLYLLWLALKIATAAYDWKPAPRC